MFHGHKGGPPSGTGLGKEIPLQESVLVQPEHLRTHPAVAAGLAQMGPKLHGWMYKIETGEVFAFDPASGQFAPIADLNLPDMRPAPPGAATI